MGLLDDMAEKTPRAPAAAGERRAEKRYTVALDLKEEMVFLTAGESSVFEFLAKNTGTEDDEIHIKLDLLYHSKEGEPAEWSVEVAGVEPKSWDVTFTQDFEKHFDLVSDGEREAALTVTCPRGVTYGDQLKVVVTLFSGHDPAATDAKTVTFTARQAVMAVKTSIGHERTVADSIASRATAKDAGVFSLLAPANTRGYIFVESMNPDRLEEIVRAVRRAHGVVRGESTDTTIDSITHYLTPKPLVSSIMEGDIVELVAGPFKGEKARVQKIDEAKEEITVELFEAMVPIPVTVRADSVRVLEKDER